MRERKINFNIIFAASSAAYLFFALPDKEGLTIWGVLTALSFLVCLFLPDIMNTVKRSISGFTLLFPLIPEFFGILTLYSHHVRSDELVWLIQKINLDPSYVGAIFFVMCLLCGIAAYPFLVYLCTLLKLMITEIRNRSLKPYFECVLNKWIVLSVLLVVILQIGINVYYGSCKPYNLTGDEYLTMVLSDNPDGMGAALEKGHWHNGSYYKDIYSVTENRRFNYLIPYINQIMDVHPPLYYFIIHSFNSAFSLAFGEVNKWSGMIPNLLFDVITSIFLFCLFYDMTKKGTISLLISSMWALSIGQIETAVFIRMYSLFTMWAVMMIFFSWLYFRDMGSESLNGSSLIPVSGCITCGLLTHYYSSILAFLLFSFVSVWFLINKELIRLKCWFYSFALSAIMAVFIFPRMITHIFASYQGKASFGNAFSFIDYGNKLKIIVKHILKDTFYEGLVFLLIFILLIVIFTVLTAKQEIQPDKALAYSMIIMICAVLYVIITAKVTPLISVRYFMCVLPIIACVPVFIMYDVLKPYNTLAVTVILSIFVIVHLSGSHYFEKVSLVLETASNGYSDGRNIAKEYSDLSAIAMLGPDSNDTLSFEFSNYDRVYICDTGQIDSVDTLLDEAGECIIYFDDSYAPDRSFSDLIHGIYGDDICLNELFSNGEHHIFYLDVNYS